MTVLDGVDCAAAGRPAPDRTTSGRVTPDRTATGRAAPDRTASDRAAPDRTASDRAAPGRTASDRAADRTTADRAALARAVLARAELRTGARSTMRSGGGSAAGSRAAATRAAATGAEGVGASGGATNGAGASGAGGTHAGGTGVGASRATEVPARAVTRSMGSAVGPVAAPEPAQRATGAVPTPGSSLTHPDRPPLPVSPALAELLPEGALRRGASLVVTGSTSLLLALVARASQEGSWVGVVGLPAVGLLAAQQSGVVLDRLALVPRPGPDAPTVLAALLDGVDLVVVGDDAALVDSDRRRLTARARERGTVLLSTAPWPGAHVVLTAEPVEWTGLGAGYGHLDRHRVAVTRGGRGSAGRGVRTEVVLPVRPQDAPATSSTTTATQRPAGTAPAPVRVPLRMVG